MKSRNFGSTSRPLRRQGEAGRGSMGRPYRRRCKDIPAQAACARCAASPRSAARSHLRRALCGAQLRLRELLCGAAGKGSTGEVVFSQGSPHARPRCVVPEPLCRAPSQEAHKVAPAWAHPPGNSGSCRCPRSTPQSPAPAGTVISGQRRPQGPVAGAAGRGVALAEQPQGAHALQARWAGHSHAVGSSLPPIICVRERQLPLPTQDVLSGHTTAMTAAAGCHAA